MVAKRFPSPQDRVRFLAELPGAIAKLLPHADTVA